MWAAPGPRRRYTNTERAAATASSISGAMSSVGSIRRRIVTPSASAKQEHRSGVGVGPELEHAVLLLGPEGLGHVLPREPPHLGQLAGDLFVALSQGGDLVEHHRGRRAPPRGSPRRCSPERGVRRRRRWRRRGHRRGAACADHTRGGPPRRAGAPWSRSSSAAAHVTRRLHGRRGRRSPRRSRERRR